MVKHRGMTKAIVALTALLLIGGSAFAGGTWVKTRIGLRAKASDPLASGKAVYREKDFSYVRHPESGSGRCVLGHERRCVCR